MKKENKLKKSAILTTAAVIGVSAVAGNIASINAQEIVAVDEETTEETQVVIDVKEEETVTDVEEQTIEVETETEDEVEQLLAEDIEEQEEEIVTTEEVNEKAVLSGDSVATTESGIEINAENFPDEGFRAWVSKWVDSPTGNNGNASQKDGILTVDEIKNFTSAKLTSTANFSNLTGIEYLTGLTSLTIEAYSGTEIDLSKLSNLKTLTITSGVTTLKSLKLGVNNTNLKTLTVKSPSIMYITGLSEIPTSTTINVTGSSLVYVNLPSNYSGSFTANSLVASSVNAIGGYDLEKDSYYIDLKATFADSDIDVTKISNVKDDSATGTSPNYDSTSGKIYGVTPGMTVTYTYDCGNSKTINPRVEINGIVTESQATVQVGDSNVTLPTGTIITSDGMTMPSGTVLNNEGIIELSGINDVTFTISTGTEIDENGSIIVSEVTVSNSLLENIKISAPADGTVIIASDGSITVSDSNEKTFEIETGDLKVTLPTGTIITSDGMTMPNGTVLNNDGVVELSGVNDVTFTIPTGTEIDENGSIIVPAGQEVTVSNSTSENIKISAPSDGTVTIASDGSITVSGSDEANFEIENGIKLNLGNGSSINDSGNVITGTENTLTLIGGNIVTIPTSSTVEGDGTIILANGGSIIIPVLTRMAEGDITAEVPEGSTVDTTNGKVTVSPSVESATLSNGVVIPGGSTIQSNGTASVPSTGGSVTLSSGVTVEVPSSSIVNLRASTVTIEDGGNITLSSGVTIRVPENSVVNEDGTVTIQTAGKVKLSSGVIVGVPENSMVNVDGTITIQEEGDVSLPIWGTMKITAGSTIDENGNIITSSSGGSITLSNGVAIPGGSIIHPDGTVTLTESGGSITLPSGEIVVVPEGSTVNEDGTITTPEGEDSEVTLPSGETVVVPGGSTVNTDGTITTPEGEDSEVTLSNGETVVVPGGTVINSDETMQAEETSKTPNTGDISQVGLWGSMVGISTILLGIFGIKRKKKIVESEE